VAYFALQNTLSKPTEKNAVGSEGEAEGRSAMRKSQAFL